MSFLEILSFRSSWKTKDVCERSVFLCQNKQIQVMKLAMTQALNQVRLFPEWSLRICFEKTKTLGLKSEDTARSVVAISIER